MNIPHWLNGDDDQDDCFFEMRIVVDEITKDVSIVVTVAEKTRKRP